MTTREDELVAAEVAAFQQVHAARDAYDAATKAWTAVKAERDAELLKRLPREEELTYAYGTCPCGAHLAYRTGTSGGFGAWDCADVLLGRAVPAGQEGSVQHTEVMPFAFWSVKSDPARKTPR